MKIHLSLEELNAYDPHEGHRRLCPLCGDGKPRDNAHRSLSFDPQNGLWKCFRCGQSGKLREFWAESGLPPRQNARARLRAAFDLPVKAPVTAQEAPFGAQPASIPQSASKAQKTALNSQRNDLWRSHWEATTALEGTAGEIYLQSRGVPPGMAAVAQVRFAPAWFGQASVVFPLKDRQCEMVAAQGRAVRGPAKLTSGPKRAGIFRAPALKSHAINSGAIFEPFDAAVPVVILTEAPIDALSLAVCGFPALALCGTSGPAWLHMVCGLRSVALAFDADEAGEKAAGAVSQQLQPFGAKCRRLVPPQGKDWNEALLSLGNAALADWLTSRILLDSKEF